MAPHEERVVEEKRELDDKIVKLVQFICTSSKFPDLTPNEQADMREQRSTMIHYSDLLARRIARFDA